MPSGAKKRRAQKKKNEAAAAREKTENEAPLTAISKENSPVMQTERTDVVTAVFDEPTVVLPRRTVLLKNMLASEVLDLKRKDTEEGTKENALPAEIYLSVQSQSVAEPFEKNPDDKINVVGESSSVAAPYVIELDSEDEDGDSMISADICDLEGKDTEGTIENPVPTETYSSIPVSEPPEDQRIFEHKEDNAVKKNQDLVTSSNRVAVENKGTATPNEVGAPEKSEADQINELEATMMNQEAAVSEYVNNIEKNTLEAVVENQETAAVLEYVNDIEKNTLEAVVEKQETAAVSEYVNDIDKNTLEAVVENQETAAANEVDAPENTKAVQEGEIEVAVKNQEAAISEDVNDSEKNTIKVVALREKFETIPDNLEAAVAAKPAVDIIYQTHDAVSTELVRPEVKKQLKEIKEMVEDVLNRMNAIDALLDRN